MKPKENLALDVSSDLEFVLEVFLGPPLPTPSLACAAKKQKTATKRPKPQPEPCAGSVSELGWIRASPGRLKATSGSPWKMLDEQKSIGSSLVDLKGCNLM